MPAMSNSEARTTQDGVDVLADTDLDPVAGGVCREPDKVIVIDLPNLGIAFTYSNCGGTFNMWNFNR
ncbi:MAG: hypothetical protein J0H42_05070 [Rhizobiales bacterium]|nr:hypothetical protein [Hyphomicrobiales bacterium]